MSRLTKRQFYWACKALEANRNRVEDCTEPWEVSLFLEDTTGRELSDSTIYYMLQTVGFRLRSPNQGRPQERAS